MPDWVSWDADLVAFRKRSVLILTTKSSILWARSSMWRISASQLPMARGSVSPAGGRSHMCTRSGCGSERTADFAPVTPSWQLGYESEREQQAITVDPQSTGVAFSPRNPLVVQGMGMSRERGRRTDYIIVRCVEDRPILDVLQAVLAFAEPRDGVWASDHFGVVADLAPNGLLGAAE